MNLWQGKKIKLREACEEDYMLYEAFQRDTDSQKLYEKIDFSLNEKSIREFIKKQMKITEMTFSLSLKMLMVNPLVRLSPLIAIKEWGILNSVCLFCLNFRARAMQKRL